ncbi:MAG: hypothetical protein ACLQDY_20645 [Streptosporangiaceae bacterium]
MPPPAPAQPVPAFMPRPAHGRVFTVTRAVRSAEVAPDGRLRFDTLARYLQEVAEDDIADVGWQEPYVWLMRRVTVRVRESGCSVIRWFPRTSHGSWRRQRGRAFGLAACRYVACDWRFLRLARQ